MFAVRILRGQKECLGLLGARVTVSCQIGVLWKRACSHCGDTPVLSLLLELYSPFVPLGLRFLLFKVSCILEFPVLPHYFIFALV